VVGLLIQAKRKSLLDEIRPQLDSLRRQAGFYISDSVYETALDLAQEL
jgi:predicted nucleic acid-binding protein